MLRGLQPLKLLGNAAMKAKSPISRPPVTFDYEQEQDNADNDANSTSTGNDDEIPIFSSPLEHDETVPAVVATTPSEESDPPSTPVEAPKDPVAATTPHQTPPPKSPVKNTESSPTLAEPSARDQSDKTTQQGTIPSNANTITPCLKEKGPSHQKTKKRLGLAEQTHQSSLQMAQKLLQYNEATCKILHDEYKRSQKVVKRLQQQLQEAQGIQQQWQTQLDEALKHKKDAAKEYKTLTRLWEKYTTSEQKKEAVRKEELTVLKKEAMRKRRVGEHETDSSQPPNKKRNQGDQSTKNGKKLKTKTSKKGKNKEDNSNDDDDESSDSEADQRNSSEDDDSDWEGARRIRGPGPTTTTTAAAPCASVVGVDSNKRTSGRRKACVPKEWSCPTCTLLNPPDLEECDACGTPK